ncbi:hypothetical protein MCOR16_011317 [Pyricularia oryzae]|nr:hypothetical protein MCOR15_001152 [Pyricularia oryzae]KAI6511626.1 hypothetical protein MCOR16_011317 [Pyricularia oryzae]
MSDLMFPGLADRAAKNSQFRGAGASNSSPAAGPRITGRIRTLLPDKGKPRSASGPVSRAITKWRPVVKGMLEIWEEEKEGGGVTVAAISAEEKKEEAKRAVLRLVEVLF